MTIPKSLLNGEQADPSNHLAANTLINDVRLLISRAPLKSSSNQVVNRPCNCRAELHQMNERTPLHNAGAIG